MLATGKSAGAEIGRSLPTLSCVGDGGRKEAVRRPGVQGLLVLVSCRASQSQGSTSLQACLMD